MKDWTPLWSLLGVGVGWGFTQVSAWLNARQSDQRALKEVLYFLLELHFLLSRAERLEAQLPTIVARIQQLSPAPPPEYAAEVTAQYTRLARAVVRPMLGERLATLRAGYDACLLKLAAIEPVSAFRLREQEKVVDRLAEAAPLLEHAVYTQLDIATPMPPEFADFMHEHVGPELVANARVRVEEIAARLAARLSRRTRRELVATLAKNGLTDRELLEKVDALIEKVRQALPGMVQ